MLRFRRFYSAGSHIPIDVAYGLRALSVDMRLVAGIGILALTLGLQASSTELSNQAKEEFLRTAVVAKASAAGKGITGSWRVSLEGSGMTHAASFQSVDERAFVKDLGHGVKELHFVDSYRYNIAAYRLANLLGLDDLVPVSVERKWRGKLGAMTWWVDDVMMDEADMHETIRGDGGSRSSKWLL